MEAYKNNDDIVGYTEIDLETRFTIHRTQETAYGNFFADLMRLYMDTDIALANSGSIRNDCILPAGPLKYS
jgi:2',3'-cyclic-nucleotide 2'-phosphodiesterase (5'-nucleotidase family)